MSLYKPAEGEGPWEALIAQVECNAETAQCRAASSSEEGGAKPFITAGRCCGPIRAPTCPARMRYGEAGASPGGDEAQPRMRGSKCARWRDQRR